MKAKDFLKLAGVKNEQEFYEKFPTEEAFFSAYPDAIQYKKGGKIKKSVYREFPPNVMNDGGYISPLQETAYNNDWTQAKAYKQQMSAGENVGWTALDILASPVAISGRPLSSYATHKVNPYSNKKGSAFGNFEADYIHPMVSGFLSESGIPIASQIGAAVQSVNKVVSPMVNSQEPERAALQQGLGAAGSSIGKSVSGFMNQGDKDKDKQMYGDSMMRLGGKIKMNMGGPMPESMGLNELGGPTHEQGGMGISPQTEVEGGETILEPESYVFSDSIMVPGTKKTFAQESKSIKNKYKLRPNDKLSNESMKSELEKLMNSQEETKQSMMMADQEKFAKKMQMKYGGLMPSVNVPVDRNMQPVQMWDGGYMVNLAKTIRDSQNQPITGLEQEGVQIIEPTINRVSPTENTIPMEGVMPVRTKDFARDMEITQGLATGQREVWPEYTPQNKDGSIGHNFGSDTFDPSQIKIPNSAIAGLAAGLKGTGNQRLRLTPRMRFNYLNPRTPQVLAEQQAELALASGMNTLKDNAVTQGNFIANVGNMATNAAMASGKNVADVALNTDIQNLGLANQEAQAEQARIAANNALATQFDTANLLRRDKTIDDMSRITQSQQTDNERKKQEALLLSLLDKGIVKWNPKGGGYLIKSTDENGITTWVPYNTLNG